MWIVIPRQPRDAYFAKMRFPEDRSDNGSSFVSIDQFSGKVLAVANSRTVPLGNKIQTISRVIHTGAVFGSGVRAFAAFMSLILVLQTVTGLQLWWTRRSRKVPHASASASENGLVCRNAMLEVKALVKRFGKSTVVDGISFTIGSGEVVGFVGPNGAGKSTTMKMICGLLKPNSGRVTIDGMTYSQNARIYLSKLGALIESPAFYPGLNGRAHLAYLASMRVIGLTH